MKLKSIGKGFGTAVISIMAMPALAGSSEPSPPIQSQEGGIEFLHPEALMGITKNVYLNVIDEVDGGCWTNSGAIEQEVRNILINNDVNVYLEPLVENRLMTAEVIISAVGYRTEGLCVGYANLSLIRPFIHEAYANQDGGYSYIYMGSSIDRERGFVASGESLNQSIRDSSQEFAYRLASDIVEGRETDAAQLYIKHFSKDYNAEPVTKAQRTRELRQVYENRQESEQGGA